MAKIHITVNGASQELEAGSTLDSYAESKGLGHQQGVAIAVNGKVIRRRDWITTTLEDGDVIMLLTAAQGG